MTNQEAIDQLICDKFLLLCASSHPEKAEFPEINMAIQALKDKIAFEENCENICNHNNDKIFIFPTDTKPIKVVMEGNIETRTILPGGKDDQLLKLWCTT